eukprot:4408557-Pleurochrysis_carterae.AAC.1
MAAPALAPANRHMLSRPAGSEKSLAKERSSGAKAKREAPFPLARSMQRAQDMEQKQIST